jgi:glycosyltransferase involved in cell wall biosynthesis
MKVSVITVCYNARSTIRDTIESVIAQDYPDIEYIVVDGASSDGTTEILSEYRNRIDRLVSEQDAGIYDAMNKAWKMATGEFIGFLHADDCFSHEGCVRQIADSAAASIADVIITDVEIVARSKTSRTLRHYSARGFSRRWFEQGDMPPHPGMYVRRSVFERFGGFDRRFPISSDFDFAARVLYVHALKYEVLPLTLVRMRHGGMSTKWPMGPVRTIRDVYRSCRKNEIPITPFSIVAKYLRKIGQLSFAARQRS